MKLRGAAGRVFQDRLQGVVGLCVFDALALAAGECSDYNRDTRRDSWPWWHAHPARGAQSADATQWQCQTSSPVTNKKITERVTVMQYPGIQNISILPKYIPKPNLPRLKLMPPARRSKRQKPAPEESSGAAASATSQTQKGRKRKTASNESSGATGEDSGPTTLQTQAGVAQESMPGRGRVAGETATRRRSKAAAARENGSDERNINDQLAAAKGCLLRYEHHPLYTDG